MRLKGQPVGQPVVAPGGVDAFVVQRPDERAHVLGDGEVRRHPADPAVHRGQLSDRQHRHEAEDGVDHQHEHRAARRGTAIGEAEQAEDRMDHHRRRQQVEPECDVRAAGLAGRVRSVPGHGEQEHADTEQQQEGEHDRVAQWRGRHRRADQRHDDAGDRGGTGRDRDRHPESPPVQPRRAGADGSGGGGKEAAQHLVVLDDVRADAEDERETGRRQGRKR